MGITGSCAAWRKLTGAEAGSGNCQLVLATLLLLLFWIFDAAIEAHFFSGRPFSHSLLAPSAHELAQRSLVMLLIGCFLLYTSRAARVRASLERELQDAWLSAERERTKVVAVVEAMGDAISIHDPRMTVLYQNLAHQELMGCHVGESCYRAYRNKSEVCSDCHLLLAFQDGAVHRVEMEFQRGAQSRYLEIIATALKDPAGGGSAGIQVMRDITDRKLAQQVASDEAALLQHLIDTIPNPIYHQDLCGRFIWCNSAFAGWLDKPRQLIIGRTIEELAPSQVCPIYRDDQPDPEHGSGREVSLQRGDGEARDVIFYKSRFAACAGEKGGVVGIIIDITQRKSAEKEVVELNAALMQQALELNRANRDLNAFSHAVSHDLRTPLTRIYSSGQALQEFCEGLDQDGLFFVKSINDGCLQIEALLDALMALFRVTEAKLVSERVDLSALAREKAEDLRRLEPARRVCFLIAPQLQAQGDPKLLSIALENLMGNAWKYTSQVEEAVIELGSLVDGEGEHLFFLSDNGAGFDDSLREELFKPFRRLHSPQQFPGTGLGLATVRRIIRRHNGRIWGEGNPGCGAIFYFTING